MSIAENKKPLVFRLTAEVKMNRPINPEKDYISPGGYIVTLHGKKYQFDFCESASGRAPEDASILEIEAKNPDFDYADTADITVDLLKHIEKIDEVFVFTGKIGETDLKPTELLSLRFVSPYAEFEDIVVPKNICKAAVVASNVS